MRDQRLSCYSRDGARHVAELLEVDQVLDVISVRKRSGECAVLVLPDALLQLRSHADVEVFEAAGEDVNVSSRPTQTKSWNRCMAGCR